MPAEIGGGTRSRVFVFAPLSARSVCLHREPTPSPLGTGGQARAEGGECPPRAGGRTDVPSPAPSPLCTPLLTPRTLCREGRAGEATKYFEEAGLWTWCPSFLKKQTKKRGVGPWLVWLRGQSVGLWAEGSRVRFSSRARPSVAGSSPARLWFGVACRRQPIGVSLSHQYSSLSLPLSSSSSY